MAKILEDRLKLEEDIQLEQLKGKLSTLIKILAVAMSLFHLYTAEFGVLEAMQQRSVHLLFALVLIFLVACTRGNPSRFKVFLNLLLVGLTLLSVGYIFLKHAFFLGTITGGADLSELFLGAFTIILVLEATRQSSGMALPLISIVFLAYGYIGPYLPEAISHRGFTLERIINQLYLFHEGIFGVPLGVSSTYVILFIIFSAFLEVSGTGQFFIDFAQGLFGVVRGGPAKVSVVASGLFGTISGSAVANVMVDGWLTIPLMRKVGFRPHIAAAVEAVASTGGQLMPPVMGAAAFLIAEILGISYLDVCIAAALPAVLYYAALFVMVDIEAAKTGLQGLSRSELPSVTKTLKRGWYLLLSPVALVYFMAVVSWSPLRSAFWSIVVAIGASALRPETRLGYSKLMEGLSKGAINILQVAATCACAGIIIGIFTMTGLGSKLSSLLIYLSGGSLALLLVLTMVASLILGMGLPTLPCYLILAILVAPALVEMGVLPIAAHLFIFYFGIISAITPPVALAAYAAAGVGETDPMRTGYAAWRIGLCAFLLPFMFVYGPILLMKGSALRIILATISGLFGVTALAASVQGYLFRKTNILERIALFGAALLLIDPGLTTDMIGYALVIAVITSQGGWSRITQWGRRRDLLLRA